MASLRECVYHKPTLESVLQILQSLSSSPSTLLSSSSSSTTTTTSNSYVYISKQNLIHELLRLPSIDSELTAVHILEELCSRSLLYKLRNDIYRIPLQQKQKEKGEEMMMMMMNDFAVRDCGKVELPLSFPFSTVFYVIDCLLQQDHLYVSNL